MIAYQEGEMDAFESLYRLICPILFQYLIARTLKRSLAEDLVQESFLQLHRSRHTYLRGKPVLPWAFAIARHVYLSNRRTWLRRNRFETLSEDDLPELPVPADVQQLAERDVVQRALVKLSVKQREVLLLHHTWGLSFREIAGVLGIGRSAAKLRAHRGILQLRRILGVGSVTSDH